MQVRELQAKAEGKSPGVMSVMSDAVAGVVRRTSPSNQPKDKDSDGNLEDGMKKVCWDQNLRTSSDNQLLMNQPIK